jgi:hypothetical protein
MSSEYAFSYDAILREVDVFCPLLLHLSRSQTVQWQVPLRLWYLMCKDLLYINLENRSNGQSECAPQDL